MLSQKALFRKPGTSSAIFALALLVAIIASMNSVVNYVNAQSEALAGLVQIGETYIILGRNATSLINSQIDGELANRLSEIAEINQAFPQKLLTAHLKTASANLKVNVRAVENVENYLRFHRAGLNGTYARSSLEANVGEILARTSNIAVNATLTLTANEKTVNLKVVGIHRTQCPLDGEILIPLTALGSLTVAGMGLSIIEFTFKQGVNRISVLSSLAERLPASIRILKVQQPSSFMQGVNMQTLAFLNLWSLAVYAIIAAASYIITARLTAESAYELAMLKALGAKKRQIIISILGYVAATAILGSILGIALGVAGAQAVSTLLRWLYPTMEVSPFLEAGQALNTIILTLASSVFGCAIPAHRSACIRYMEQQL